MKFFSPCLATLALSLCSHFVCAVESVVEIEPIVINRRDFAAQQRGAATFFQYCSGCHSLKQMRYTDLAYKFRWVNANGDVDQNLIFEYLNFVNDNAASPIISSLNPVDAQQWFGKVPPDLSLVVRSRSRSWVGAFLKGFYPDHTQSTGVSNHVFGSQVAMPHVLIEQEGWERLAKIHEQGDEGDVVLLSGKTEQNYDRLISDLVHFLDYVAEPHRLQRETMGKYVLLFLVALSVIHYLYYRSVWSQNDDEEY
jgi:ubiquinol-cytochrome c reductase cytochrome c1 subunit